MSFEGNTRFTFPGKTKESEVIMVLSIIVDKHNSDIIFVTETWLNENVPSEVVNIPGLIVIRKDRSSGRGGGIAIYIKDNIPVKTHYDLCDPCFECLWITFRPKWLPRSISRIAAACLYLPPNMLSCISG